MKFGRKIKRNKLTKSVNFGFQEVSCSGNESSRLVLKFSGVLGLKNIEKERKIKFSVLDFVGFWRISSDSQLLVPVTSSV